MTMTNGEHIRISATHVRITRAERRVLLSLLLLLLLHSARDNTHRDKATQRG